jgi:hypothetical protein
VAYGRKLAGTCATIYSNVRLAAFMMSVCEATKKQPTGWQVCSMRSVFVVLRSVPVRRHIQHRVGSATYSIFIVVVYYRFLAGRWPRWRKIGLDESSYCIRAKLLHDECARCTSFRARATPHPTLNGSTTYSISSLSCTIGFWQGDVGRLA